MHTLVVAANDPNQSVDDQDEREDRNNEMKTKEMEEKRENRVEREEKRRGRAYRKHEKHNKNKYGQEDNIVDNLTIFTCVSMFAYAKTCSKLFTKREVLDSCAELRSNAKLQEERSKSAKGFFRMSVELSLLEGCAVLQIDKCHGMHASKPCQLCDTRTCRLSWL